MVIYTQLDGWGNRAGWGLRRATIPHLPSCKLVEILFTKYGIFNKRQSSKVLKGERIGSINQSQPVRTCLNILQLYEKETRIYG